MGLINCPECNRQISELAAVCPQCGWPVPRRAAESPDSPGATGLVSAVDVWLGQHPVVLAWLLILCGALVLAAGNWVASSARTMIAVLLGAFLMLSGIVAAVFGLSSFSSDLDRKKLGTQQSGAGKQILAYLRSHWIGGSLTAIAFAIFLGGSVNRLCPLQYRNRGSDNLQANRFDEAIADFDKALLYDGANSRTYEGRGIAWMSKGNYDNAVRDFVRSTELDPTSATAFNFLGMAYEGKGDVDMAITNYTKSIELDPKAALPYQNRAAAWQKKGNLEMMRADLAAAKRLNPAMAESLNQSRPVSDR